MRITDHVFTQSSDCYEIVGATNSCYSSLMRINETVLGQLSSSGDFSGQLIHNAYRSGMYKSSTGCGVKGNGRNVIPLAEL